LGVREKTGEGNWGKGYGDQCMLVGKVVGIEPEAGTGRENRAWEGILWLSMCEGRKIVSAKM